MEKENDEKKKAHISVFFFPLSGVVSLWPHQKYDITQFEELGIS